MHPMMRLYEDVLSSAENIQFRLPPLPRFIFVVHGSRQDRRHSRSTRARPGRAKAAVTVKPGAGGVTCWRWELARGDQGCTAANAPGMTTHEKLTAFLETLPKGELLMRGDSVAFPPGGCAYLASPSGPGHPLPDRGRHPHRHARPLDVATARAAPGTRCGPDAGVRAGGSRQAEPLHPRDDPAARAARQKLDPVRQRGGQGEAEVPAVQDLCRRADLVRAKEVTV